MTTIETKLTPQQLAEAFAVMNSSDQAEFFGHVSRVVEAEGFWAEQQWHYMCGHIEKEEWLTRIDPDLATRAKETLMSMAAPLYLHTLNYVDGLSA